MNTALPDASDSPAWAALATEAKRLRATSTAALFAADPQRSEACTARGAGLVLDYSRQRVDAAVMAQLAQLADDLRLRERIAAMYRGEVINNTERRAVLHTGLRRPQAPVAGEARIERERMLDFAEGVRNGGLRGSTGERFDLVVNIGIGGSDLGPAMACEALEPYAEDAPHILFVSNVDGCRLADVLEMADPNHTLFIVCSKTFTTQETRANADTARRWLVEQLGEAAVPHHFAAVSVNGPALNEFGIHPDHRFVMWDWVGGRYSLWSSIGLALAVGIGRRRFEAFLAGGAEMDEHFAQAPWLQNLPALMGLLGCWNINHLDLPTLAVLPYDDRLARFPAYLQQLDMESNGKSVRRDGRPVFCGTAPVVWGEPGNNAQHSFFQMLHQGTPRAALDMLLVARSSCGNPEAHQLAVANCLGQAEAFAFGAASDNPQKVHEGNRPLSLLLLPRLDAANLGRLVALYEHKVFVQSVVWGINAFDQWGVELGKRMAHEILPMLQGSARSSARAAAPVSLKASLSLLESLAASEL